MQINNALNLVFPARVRVEDTPDTKNPAKTVRETTTLIWAYHTPISQEVFMANYRVIAATKWALFKQGVAYAATNGPRIASLALADAASADAAESGSENLAPPLLAEIRRLTTILAPGKNGYDFIPLDLAVQRSIIDAEEADEAQSALVFFTCAYAMSGRLERTAVAKAMAWALGGSITSLTPTEYGASLQTLTPKETSGKQNLSSPAS